MKCYYTYQDGVRYLIPQCYDVLYSDDIEDCNCSSPLTGHQFEKERFNKVVAEKNETIEILLSENARLLKEMTKLLKKKDGNNKQIHP